MIPHPWKIPLAALLLAAAACAHTSALSEAPSTGGVEPLAEQVVIYRDAWGVPHVHGETDAAAVFGFMYARAEDDLHFVEGRVLWAIGRLAEREGASATGMDLRTRALETERHSRAEYERVPPEFRVVAEAWAAGLNHYRERHPDGRASPLARFEPWHLFALGRSVAKLVPDYAPEQPLASELTEAVAGTGGPRGSNMWMIGPSRSASGQPMLFINPHIPIDQATLLREGHLLSDEGLNVYGGFWPGDPFPAFGHTPRHGWTVTVNFPDLVDLWELTFDHSTDPLAYRYADGHLRAEEWTETLRVRTDTGIDEREVTFRKSHHGPVVAVRDGRPLAMRIARYEDGGYYQQVHGMARARTFREFQDAVGMLRLLGHNLGYADRDGNVWYLYNSPVPRRPEGFDWSRPLDGSDPGTEWRGYHTLEELPQVLNPGSGWIVNTNTSPFEATAEGENPDLRRYPGYMVGEAGDHPVYDTFRDFTASRLHASRRILSGTGHFTLDDLARAVSSRRVFQADHDVAALLGEWDRLMAADPSRAEALRPAVERLRGWDRVSGTESTQMTLYMHWSLAYRGAPAYWFYNSLEPASTGEWARIQALETAVADLERDWGTSFVPWGEISRLQRPVNGAFSDERPSTPVAGSSGLFGLLHEFNPMPVEGQRRWYGRGGNSYVSVVEFGPEVRARTVLPFGQSTDPDSPHYRDQSELYGRGELKPVWTSLEEVRANAVRSYRPGEGA
jgi:acyl-homoserine-lactone acylase